MYGWSDRRTDQNRINQLERHSIFAERTDNPRPLIHRDGVRKYKDENYVWNVSKLRRCPAGSRRYPRSSHICMQYNKTQPQEDPVLSKDSSTHFEFGQHGALLRSLRRAGRNEPLRSRIVKELMDQAEAYNSDHDRYTVNTWLSVQYGGAGRLTQAEYDRLKAIVATRRQQLGLPPLPEPHPQGFDYKRPPKVPRGRPKKGIGRRPVAAAAPVPGTSQPVAAIAAPIPPAAPVVAPGQQGVNIHDIDEEGNPVQHIGQAPVVNPVPGNALAAGPSIHSSPALSALNELDFGGLDLDGFDVDEPDSSNVVHPPHVHPPAPPVAHDAPLKRKRVNPFGLVGGIGQKELYIAQQHQIMNDLRKRNLRRSARLNAPPTEPYDPRRRSARLKKK